MFVNFVNQTRVSSPYIDEGFPLLQIFHPQLCIHTLHRIKLHILLHVAQLSCNHDLLTRSQLSKLVWYQYLILRNPNEQPSISISLQFNSQISTYNNQLLYPQNLPQILTDPSLMINLHRTNSYLMAFLRLPVSIPILSNILKS